MTEAKPRALAETVAEAQSGDPQAFERLLERTEKLVRKLAFPIVGRELVEDALQEVYLVAFRNLSKLLEPGAIIPWLSRITLHVSYRLAKKNQASAPLENQGSSPDQTESVATKVSLQQALKSLKREDSEVLLLREMLGLSYGDLAHTLRIPIGTVKSRLSKARERLREALTSPQKTQEP